MTEQQRKVLLTMFILHGREYMNIGFWLDAVSMSGAGVITLKQDGYIEWGAEGHEDELRITDKAIKELGDG